MTYEYACTSCGHEWEVEQSIKDDPLKECPKCKNDTARRQISRGTGFILKGSGWYSDLYSSSSNKKPEGDAASKDAASPGASESTSTGAASTDAGSSSGSTAAASPATPAPTAPAKPSSS
jgi:putative FmdB family regulatory protein